MSKQNETIHYLKRQQDPPKGFQYEGFMKSVDACRPLFDGLHGGFHGKKLDIVHIRYLACLLKDRLKWGKAAAFEEALKPFLEKTVGNLTMRRMLMKVLANREVLVKLGRIPSWTGKPGLWTYADVLECAKYKDKRTGTELASCKFLSCSGITAGTVYLFRLTPRYTRWLIKEISGCPRFESCELQEFTGMRLNLKLGINPNNRFYILEVQTSDAQKKHNRALRRKRTDHINNTMKNCTLRCECTYCPIGRTECLTSCREFSRSINDDASKKTGGGQVVCSPPGHLELV